MGYCNGAWFSDYNYRAMQTHLEGQPQLAIATAATAQAGAPESELLLVSGVIGLDGVAFAPVQPLRGRPALGSGDYTLRIQTRDGRTIEHAFNAELVDHAVPPERHFAFTFVNRVRSRGSSVEWQHFNAGDGAPSATDPPVNWSERRHSCVMSWNIVTCPDGRRTVSRSTDGRATATAVRRTAGRRRVRNRLVRRTELAAVVLPLTLRCDPLPRQQRLDFRVAARPAAHVGAHRQHVPPFGLRVIERRLHQDRCDAAAFELRRHFGVHEHHRVAVHAVIASAQQAVDDGIEALRCCVAPDVNAGSFHRVLRTISEESLAPATVACLHH
jgi:hypothetical protein